MLWLAHVGLSVPQCPGLTHCLAVFKRPGDMVVRMSICFRSLALSPMDMDLETKAKASALMIWANRRTSRSRFSRSIIRPTLLEVCSTCLQRLYAPFDPRRCSQQTAIPEPLDPQVARSPLPSPQALRHAGLQISVVSLERKGASCVGLKLECATGGAIALVSTHRS
jgi:hypothetical protein